jgi:hypothetical protein
MKSEMAKTFNFEETLRNSLLKEKKSEITQKRRKKIRIKIQKKI